jgi:hypothetical protein
MIYRLGWYEAWLDSVPGYKRPDLPPFEPGEVWLALQTLVDLDAFDEASELRVALVETGWYRRPEPRSSREKP